VLFHLLVRHENLVRAMVSGRKPWPDEQPQPLLRFTAGWLAALLFAISLGVVLATLALLGR
jgi:hypothetical protein